MASERTWYRVTYTSTEWPEGTINTWTTDQVQLDWFMLKQRMGMHPSTVLLDIEPMEPRSE